MTEAEKIAALKREMLDLLIESLTSTLSMARQIVAALDVPVASDDGSD